MPDIALRFHKDMLTISAPLDAALTRQGVDVDRDMEYLVLVEPETILDILRLESTAGAQCLTTPTEGITRARLAHHGLEDCAEELAQNALDMVRELAPQHILVEIGPCRLPLDPSSKSSLNEHRDQYASAARCFESEDFDAYLLSSFEDITELKCAIMGLRQVSDRPIFASVRVNADGTLTSGRGTMIEAAEMMTEYEASVIGFQTAAPIEDAMNIALSIVQTSPLPIMATLEVKEYAPRQWEPTPDNPYCNPDVMVDNGIKLHNAGVQFLRVCGQATPAYTGALVAGTLGVDVAKRA